MKTDVTRIEQAVYWHERHPFLHVRSTFSSKQPYATHFHDCLSLGVLFKGGTVVRCNGVASTIHAGRMALIAPMEPHSCNPLGDRARGYHMLYIDRAWALDALGAPPGSRLDVRERILDDSDFWNAMMHLAAAIREGRDDAPGCDALAEAIRAHVGVLPVGEETPAKVLSAWAGGLDATGERAASVEERARELGMRRESFIRSFRRTTGVTPVQYRQCLRLIRAREHLRRGHSLVETALACGYADQSHFHRMCVKYLSATPVQMTPRKSLSFKK